MHHPDQALFKKARQVFILLEKAYGIPRWRQPLAPVDELVSTILSQNTSDTNRDRAFNQLKKSFNSWEMVRDAPKDTVIEAIRPAGLANQKGPRIQSILRQITAERGELCLGFLKELGKEKARKWLLDFKGVGPKTAAIVLQFSLQIPAFPVDTHIYRVSGRVGLRPPELSAEKTHQWMEALFKAHQYEPAHLNLIRLGREVCHPRKPDCDACPLKGICVFCQNQAAV